MDKGRIAFGLALNNTLNEFYVVSGQIDKHQITDSCEKYLINCNKWITLPSLQRKKMSNSAAVLGNYLYSFGGVSKSSHYLNEIEMLDLGLYNCWV
jgi:Kelch motif